MRLSFLLLSPLVFLVGCPDETITMPTEPPPAKAVKLQSGDYAVLVTGVSLLDCKGARESDVWGMKIPMSLRVSGPDNVADFAGTQLYGNFLQGQLFLESGTASGEETVVEDQPTEADEDEGEDVSSSSSSSSGSSGGAPVEPRPSEVYTSLDLKVTSAQDASGVWFFESRGCQMEAQVVVRGFGNGGDEFRPLPAEEEPEREGEEADCG